MGNCTSNKQTNDVVDNKMDIIPNSDKVKEKKNKKKSREKNYRQESIETLEDSTEDNDLPPPPPINNQIENQLGSTDKYNTNYRYSNDSAYSQDEPIDFPQAKVASIDNNDKDEYYHNNDDSNTNSNTSRDLNYKASNNWEIEEHNQQKRSKKQHNTSTRKKPVAWNIDDETATSENFPKATSWEIDTDRTPSTTSKKKKKESKPAFGAGKVDRLLAEKKLEEERLRLKARRKRMLAKAKAKEREEEEEVEEDVDNKSDMANNDSYYEDNDDDIDDIKKAIHTASISQVFNILKNKQFADASTQTDQVVTNEIVIQTDISGWSGVYEPKKVTEEDIRKSISPSNSKTKESRLPTNRTNHSAQLSSDLNALKARLNNLANKSGSVSQTPRGSKSASPFKRSKSMIIPDSARSRTDYVKRSGRRSPTIRRHNRRRSLPTLSLDESSSESGDTDESDDEAATKRLPLHLRSGSDATLSQQGTILRSQSVKRLRTTGIARSIKSGTEFIIQIGPRKRKCILKGVVPPEHPRHFDTSRRTLGRMINSKEVTLDVWKTKHRGEVWEADVFLGPLNIREELLKKGLVRLKKSEKRQDLRHYAAEARKNQLGMWAIDEAPLLDEPLMDL